MPDIQMLLAPIRTLHEQIRAAVVAKCEQAALEDLSRVAHEAEEDTIYAVDRVSEALLVDFFEREVAPSAPLVLIAEGLAEGQVVLPRGSQRHSNEYCAEYKEDDLSYVPLVESSR